MVVSRVRTEVSRTLRRNYSVSGMLASSTRYHNYKQTLFQCINNAELWLSAGPRLRGTSVHRGHHQY